jgi:type IV pilus assembly protein PilV
MSSNITSSHAKLGTRHPISQKGFTLIEILVSVVILSIGLLGVASLQVQGLKNNQSAYLRSQASILAYDIADRMRTNSAQAIQGEYDDFDSLGSVPSDPACSTSNNGCSPAELVETDLFEWARRLNGTAESMILLPDAQGKIIRHAGNLFTIQINWNETSWDDESESKVITAQNFSVNLVL